jgi:hypothetical protein
MKSQCTALVGVPDDGKFFNISARVKTDFFSSVLGGQDRIFQARLDFSKNKIILAMSELV